MTKFGRRERRIFRLGFRAGREWELDAQANPFGGTNETENALRRAMRWTERELEARR